MFIHLPVLKEKCKGALIRVLLLGAQCPQISVLTYSALPFTLRTPAVT